MSHYRQTTRTKRSTFDSQLHVDEAGEYRGSSKSEKYDRATAELNSFRGTFVRWVLWGFSYAIRTLWRFAQSSDRYVKPCEISEGRPTENVRLAPRTDAVGCDWFDESVFFGRPHVPNRIYSFVGLRRSVKIDFIETSVKIFFFPYTKLRITRYSMCWKSPFTFTGRTRSDRRDSPDRLANGFRGCQCAPVGRSLPPDTLYATAVLTCVEKLL